MNAPFKTGLLGLVLIAAAAAAFATPAAPEGPAPRLDPRHVSAHGVPDDFIFAAGYTWLRLR